MASDSLLIGGAVQSQTHDHDVIAYAGRATVGITSIANATWLPVTFTSQDYDTTGDIFDAGTPTRLTIPKDGFYLVRSEVQFDGSTTGTRWLALVKNGTIDNATGSPTAGGTLISTFALGGVPGADTRLQAAAEIELADGDYVTANIRQSSGGALNIENAFLSIFRLGSLP